MALGYTQLAKDFEEQAKQKEAEEAKALAEKKKAEEAAGK